VTTLDLQPRLYTDDEFQHRLVEETEQAARDGRAYAIVACVPQHLPGEDVTDIVDVAAECVGEFVRGEDLAGRFDDEVLAIGLAGPSEAEAGVLAHRLRSDLRVRSYHLRSTLWEIGVATLPEGGLTAQELLASAIDAARNRHRRLAG
jgi:PleD family two-component response regulator